MKRCPECRRDYYDDSLLYCLEDGTALVQGVPAGDAGAREAATAILAPAGTAKKEVDTEAGTTIYTSGQYLSNEIRRHKGVAIAIAAAILVILLGFSYGAYRWLSGADAVKSLRSGKDLKVQRLTGDGKTVIAAISPDAKLLANVRNESGQQSLWVKQIATNSNVQIVGPGVMDHYYSLRFTPDGSYVYFSGTDQKNAIGTIFKVPALGGSVAKVLANAGHFSFSPDGKQFVFDRYDRATSESALFAANVDGTGERKIAERSGHQWFRNPPAWSPDGKFVACGVSDDNLPEFTDTIAIIDLADNSVKELTPPRWDYVRGLAWLPDMSGIIFEASETGGGEAPDQLWEISYPGGDARRLTHNITDYNWVSLSDDGSTLVTIEADNNFSVWASRNADITAAEQITTGKGSYARGIAWTPDGQIVYVSSSSGIEEVWIMGADGSGAKQLTHDGRIKYTPTVSPDGRYVVFASSEKGGQLWRIDITGENPVALVTGDGTGNPDFSHDGRWIFFSAYKTGRSEIYRVSIDGGEPTQLTEFYATEPNSSPDGKLIACFYAVANFDKWQIGIIPAEGGALIKSFDVPLTVGIDFSPVWTPDGRGITYIDRRGGMGNLWVQPVDGGAPKQLTDFKQDGIFRRVWSRDGKQVAIVRGTETLDALMITGFR